MSTNISMNELLMVLGLLKDLQTSNFSPAHRSCSCRCGRNNENASTASDEAVRALSAIVSYAHEHEQAFLGRHREANGEPLMPPGGWLGYWPDGDWQYIAFYPGALTRILEELGFDPDAVIHGWYERGWLDTDRDGKRKTKVIWVGEKAARMYAIKRAAIQEPKTGFKKTQNTHLDDQEQILFEELAAIFYLFSLWCKKLSSRYENKKG